MVIEFFHPMLMMIKPAFAYLFILAAGFAAGAFITSGFFRKKQAMENKSRFWLEDLDRTVSPLVFTDLGCKIYYANRAFLSLWGYLNINEAAGKNFTELWQNKEKALQIQEKALDVDEWKDELTGQKKDGNFFEVQLSINKIKNNNGNPFCLIIAFNDITEQKKAKNILAKEYNLLRTVVDSLPDRIFIKDTESAFVFCNIASAKVFKVENTDELIGKTDFNFMSHEKALKYYEQEKEIMRTGQSMINQEFCFKDDYGITIERYFSSKIPWRDNSGKIIGLIGINHDMTEAQRAEEALAKEHNLLKSLVENLPDQIYVKDTKSAFIFANHSKAKHLGLKSLEELIGKTDFDLFSKDIAQKYRDEEIYMMEKGDSVTNRENSINWYGEDRHFLITKVPWRDKDNNIIGIIGINHEVTELKKAQDAFQESESKFRSIVETCPDVIFRLNIDGNIEYISDTARKLFGYKQNELIGINIRQLTSQEDIPLLNNALSKIHQGTQINNLTLNLNKKTGQVFPTEINIVPIKKDSEVIGAHGLLRDITERKLVEYAIQKAHDELELRVKDRTSELGKTNDELKNEIQERKKIEEQLIHYQGQLRTLASELSLTEEKLRRKIANDIHDHIGQNLAISKIKLESFKQLINNQEISGGLKEVSDIISQTIDITRTLTFEISPPVLYELGFDAALDWLVNNMQQRHKIDAEYVNDGLYKPLDNNISILLFGAVRELLVNVVKHANANRVQVSNQRIGNEISIMVSDDGIGFNSNILSSYHSNGGFGLFSIKERLGHIGGNVKIESTLNQGTLITLTAPLDNAMLTKKKDK